MKRPHRPTLLTLLTIGVLISSTGFSLQADDGKSRLKLPILNLFKKKAPAKPPVLLAPYHEFDLIANCHEKPVPVYETKTVELRRVAFQKWEEHCCGIKMKGNYMRVTYQTFFSDGTSEVWDREYRS